MVNALCSAVPAVISSSSFYCSCSLCCTDVTCSQPFFNQGSVLKIHSAAGARTDCTR